ncbi:hypothetical protein EsDP_00006401 [Epichloe bromicola]|uniref:Uncharacterized protein n=1 Tax=Epichloe bromicola TaxID=79588 RepID=A0ABQ0CY00_9HYPO
MYDTKEELNNLVWDKNDEDAEEGQNLLRLKDTCRRVERLAEQRFEEKATLIPPLISGGFNILYRLRLPDVSPDIMTAQEVATAMFLARETDIPIPNHVLEAGIGHPVLEAIWGRAAAHILQLSRPSFPRIGSSLEAASGGTYEVVGRPEGRTYETADEWYAQLADMHMAQLVFQHNDLVTSEDDCRNKYTHCSHSFKALRRWISALLDERFFGHRESSVTKDHL